MARRILDIAALLAVFLVVGVAAAAAHPPRQVTDPSATTPAGSVYAIPLESARQDAEPHHQPATASTDGGSDGGPTAGAASGPVSGSGQTAAGASPATGASGPASGSRASGSRDASGRSHTRPRTESASSGSSVLVPGGQAGSLVASSQGFGSSPEVPGLNAASSGGLAAIQGNGSDAPLLAIVLAVVVLGAGVYLGTRGRRRASRGSDSSSA